MSTYLAIVANTAYPRNHNNLLEGLLKIFQGQEVPSCNLTLKVNESCWGSKNLIPVHIHVHI